MGTPARNGRFNGRKSFSSNGSNPSKSPDRTGKGSADHEILFQKYFKSVGPRTYAAQIKKANNGNHYLVLTEGKRDEKTDEVRKTRLFVFSEDFVEFFKMIKGASEFIKANPVSPEVARSRKKFWEKHGAGAGSTGAKTSPEQRGRVAGKTASPAPVAEARSPESPVMAGTPGLPASAAS